MFSYLMRRLVAMIPVLAVVAVVSFAIVHMAPGDPVLMILGEDATPTDIENLRRQLGLDRSLPVQFANYIGQLLRGDLGTSLFFSEPVARSILQRAR